jgi:hypothetical protein
VSAELPNKVRQILIRTGGRSAWPTATEVVVTEATIFGFSAGLKIISPISLDEPIVAATFKGFILGVGGSFSCCEA